jgi:hypothetical protein
MSKLWLLLFAGSCAFGQTAQPVQYVNTDPVGACAFGQPNQWNGSSLNMWACGSDSAWHHVVSYISSLVNPASVGLVRVANSANGMCFRNDANTDDFCTVLNSSDQFVLQKAGGGSASLVIGTNAVGNYSAETELSSGGGGSVGDTAANIFASNGVFKWQAGIHDGSLNYSLRNSTTNNDRFVIFNSTGDAAFGSAVASDAGYGLDIQSSGSSGTFRVFDQTATTGSTTATIQAGAGQSTNHLLNLNNNGGTPVAFFGSDGSLTVPHSTVSLAGLNECTHGSNATCGVSTLSSGTVTVGTTAINTLATAGGAGYVVSLTALTCSSCGALSVGTVVANTSFVINSTNGSDASRVYWEIRYVN